MCKLRPLSVAIIAVFLFIRCRHENDRSYALSDAEQPTHHVSIDGVWRCTPESSLKFPNGILEPIIKISGAIYQKPTVQGCFLWDGHYYDHWELVHIQFDDSTHQLTMVDDNGSTYRGVADMEWQTIKGIVYPSDPGNDVPEDSLDFQRAGSVLAERLFMPRTPDPDGSITYTYRQPDQIEDGWLTAPVFEQISDTAALYDFMARLIRQDYGRLESLLIIKDGKLLVEEYYYGYDRTQLHNIHSCTKSVTSLLLGMTLDRHDTISVGHSIFSLFPPYEFLKTEASERINLKHVLTMTAGFNDEGSPGGNDTGDQLHHILSRPLASKPGEKFRYDNDCTDLLGYIIHSLEGKHVDKYAAENLFGPLGISAYYWETENGVPHCHSDLYLRHRDLAKIGLLVLNDGKWLDEQIVPEEWIRESTRPIVKESIYYDYGYQWWHRSKDNVAWWKEAGARIATEHDKVIALGHGGQYIIIIRDMNMVVVTTASDYADGSKARSKIPMVIEGIVPLFLDI